MGLSSRKLIKCTLTSYCVYMMLPLHFSHATTWLCSSVTKTIFVDERKANIQFNAQEQWISEQRLLMILFFIFTRQTCSLHFCMWTPGVESLFCFTLELKALFFSSLNGAEKTVLSFTVYFIRSVCLNQQGNKLLDVIKWKTHTGKHSLQKIMG